jgi:hypothetical protein
MRASADSIRDAYALVQCSLNDDRPGHDAVLACCDQAEVAGVLADTVAELFRSVSRVLSDGDPHVLLARVRDGLASEGGTEEP